MNPGSRSRVGHCVIALVAALGSLSCHAQQKFTFSYPLPPETSKYLRDHAIEVDDVPGHKVRVVEIQRTYTQEHPVLAGTKVLEMRFRGFTDYGPTGGLGHGCETWLLEDGNKVFLESVFLSASEATETGSRRGASHSTARFVGGTGKYASLRGRLVSSVEFDSDPRNGFNRPAMRGEYWFGDQ